MIAGNEKVLKLVRSEVLQTEVRLLYELLHVLHNNFRANKTLRALKQVRTGHRLRCGPLRCLTVSSSSRWNNA